MLGIFINTSLVQIGNKKNNKELNTDEAESDITRDMKKN